MAVYINGEQVNGCTNYASAVSCVDKEGNPSTVQAEIDGLNESVSEQSDKLGGLSFRENPEQKGKCQYRIGEDTWVNFNCGAISIISADHELRTEQWATSLGGGGYGYLGHVATLYTTIIFDISNSSGKIQFSGNLTISVSNDNVTYEPITNGADISGYRYLKLYYTVIRNNKNGASLINSGSTKFSYSLSTE